MRAAHLIAVSAAVLGTAARGAAVAALAALLFAQGCAAPGEASHTAAVAAPITISQLETDALVARAIAEHEMRRP
jgi:hypothetical protein